MANAPEFNFKGALLVEPAPISSPANGFVMPNIPQFPLLNIVPNSVVSGTPFIVTFVKQNLLNVTAPATGFTIIVPKNEVKYLEMSIEDALKIIVSGGVLNPKSKKVK